MRHTIFYHKSGTGLVLSLILLLNLSCNSPSSTDEKLPSLGEWTQTNGPYLNNNLATVRALISDGTYLYAGTEEGGIFRSSDEGANWVLLQSPQKINAFIFFDGSLIVGTEGGVYRSPDQGITWNWMGSGNPHRETLSFAILDSTLYTNSFYGGVYHFNKNDTLWYHVYNSWAPCVVIAGFDNILLEGVYANGIARSIDKGSSWEHVGLEDSTIGVFTKAGNYFFAGTSSRDLYNHGGIYRSMDQGKTWQPSSNGLTDVVVDAFAASGNHIFAGTQSGGVFHSVNNGSNWTQSNNKLLNTSIKSLLVKGKVLFAGTKNGGVWRNSGMMD